MKQTKEKKELSINDFVGTFWTEGLFRKNVKSIIIKVGEWEALLEYPPFSHIDEQKDKKLFDNYIAEKKKEQWQFCASWGYYFFKRKCSKEEDGKVLFNFNQKLNK